MALSERMIFFIGRSVPSGLGGVELLLSERIRTRLIGELVVVSGITRK